MSKNIQITEIHHHDVDCVVDDETIRYLILEHIAKKSGARLDLLRTYAGVKIEHRIGSGSSGTSIFTAYVTGKIPGRFELRRGSADEAPVHGAPEIKPDHYPDFGDLVRQFISIANSYKGGNGGVYTINAMAHEMARQMISRFCASSEPDLTTREKTFRNVLYATWRRLHPLDQPPPQVTERLVSEFCQAGAHALVVLPPDV